MSDNETNGTPKVRRRSAGKLKPGDRISYGGRTVEVVVSERLELHVGPRGLLEDDELETRDWVVLELLEPGFGRFRVGFDPSRMFELVS